MRSIYTIGMHELRKKALMEVIARFKINCVVDIRDDYWITHPDELSGAMLRVEFTTRSIAYLSFSQLLAFALDAKEDDKIVEAIERLNTGIERGYTILVLDGNTDIGQSVRYSVVGKRLTELGCRVLHIVMPIGACFTQSDIDESFAIKAQRRKEKRAESVALGQKGEEIATQHLRDRGFIILERNWSLHRVELDIVALKDDVVHFVEVKTRRNANVAPQEAIDKFKLRHLHKAISIYRTVKNMRNTPYLLDSIAITYRSDNDYTLNFFENIGEFARKIDD